MASAPVAARNRRLDYIDWMRGVACLLMFQTHAYDSWLSSSDRQSSFFAFSQRLGSIPAPAFLFLAGLSLALVTERMEAKGRERTSIARFYVWRGFIILLAGLAFRVQEYVFAYPWAPWTDLLRVDILNVIGLGLMACAIVPLAAGRARRVALALACSAAIALATPPLYSTWKPQNIPWWLASYVNGGHTAYNPGTLFGIFPWVGFAFAGAAVGFALMKVMEVRKERLAFPLIAALGAACWLLARWLETAPVKVYAVYDYWHSSPIYFLARTGVLLVILAVGWAWCSYRPGWLWSPTIQLGKTSLLVYWVHIEFVYGRFSILPRHLNGIPRASVGVAIIAASMVLLSIARTRLKGKGSQLWQLVSAPWRSKPEPAQNPGD